MQRSFVSVDFRSLKDILNVKSVLERDSFAHSDKQKKSQRKCFATMVYRSLILSSFQLKCILRMWNSSHYFWEMSIRQLKVWHSHGLEPLVGKILASSSHDATAYSCRAAASHWTWNGAMSKSASQAEFLLHPIQNTKAIVLLQKWYLPDSCISTNYCHLKLRTSAEEIQWILWQSVQSKEKDQEMD